MLNLDEKLDEALQGTFPASDAFYLEPDDTRAAVVEEASSLLRPSGGAGTPVPAAASVEGRRKE